MGKLTWKQVKRDLIDEHPHLPDGVKEAAAQLLSLAVSLASQITGNLELAWRRGEQSGYQEGYQDAKSGKKSRW